MKLLCSDYDGTIKQNGIVRKEDALAIESFMAAGNKFGIVTGRSISMIKNELEYFSVNYDFIVGTNGGIVVDENCQKLYSADIDFGTAAEFAEAVMKLDIMGFGVTDGADYASYLWREPAVPEKPTSQGTLIGAKEVELSAILSGGVINSFFVRANPGGDRILYEYLVKTFGGVVGLHFNNTIDVSAKGVSKKSGVDFINKYFNPGSIHVIGDGFNDIPMIEAFGGYSVTSAPPEVQKSACKSFDHISDCILHI